VPVGWVSGASVRTCSVLEPTEHVSNLSSRHLQIFTTRYSTLGNTSFLNIKFLTLEFCDLVVPDTQLGRALFSEKSPPRRVFSK